MTPLLLIAPLPPADAAGEYDWAQAGEDGIALRDQGRALLTLLPSSPEVTLGIPSAALSWHRVTLPKGSMGSTSKLRAVLDGLLEEHLLDEPETLHFALAPDAKAGEPVWVVACNRIWLRSVVQGLEAAGRRVVRIVPEFTPQPVDAPPLLLVTGEPEAPQLTVCDSDGVVSLPLAGAGLALSNGLPLDTAVISTEPAVAEAAEHLLQRRVPIVQAPQRWLHATRTPWELAQFDLAVTGRARAGKKFASVLQALRFAPEWRAARWGVVVLLLTQLIGLNAWAWKERNALESKRQATRAILTQTFPSVKIVVDAPLQMGREVAALQQAVGDVAPSDFEPMVGAIAATLPAGRSPSAIDFSAGQLRLRGLGLQPQEVTQITSALSPRGYQVRTEGDLLLVQAEANR
ncbi:type II secretion system protein GspL [Acidovorax cavernicola]|uniref:General secretion pathway protein GspL n=1 Tax=Acidovorax cavernicola TaxID=1675792 RepID=A0A9X8GUN6_9BURK|nr:type II secretion system protein GspL [Acidovorax cavernicola]RIX78583.1 general secretion pathway protein GspL [Acidovorax cavernicola]